MMLKDEYLDCIKEYSIVDQEDSLITSFKNNFNFHLGGRIDIKENKYCMKFFSLNELEEYLCFKNIAIKEKIILIPSISYTPIIETTLSCFYNCFYDCLAASSDVWVIFKKYNFIIEVNHDDEIIICSPYEL